MFPDDAGGACSGDARIEGPQQIERQHDYADCVGRGGVVAEAVGRGDAVSCFDGGELLPLSE